MSSLLSPFNFGQKHAYFHARITIHELINVPLVTGHFKARWRVKNVHGLQNIPGVNSQSDGMFDKESEGTAAGVSTDSGERRSLKHKKSFASVASQEVSSTDSPEAKAFDFASSSSPHQESSASTQRERKTSNRFLSGFKDAFHNRTRKVSYNNAHQQSETTTQAEDLRLAEEDEEGEDGSMGGEEKAESREKRPQHTHTKEGTEASGKPKRTASYKSLTAESDRGSVKRKSVTGKSKEDKDGEAVLHPHQLSLLHHAEPRGETLTEKVREHQVKWERQLEVGVRIPIEKQRMMNEKGGSTATASGALSPSGNEGGTVSSAPSNRSSFSTNRAENASGFRRRSFADEKGLNTEGDGSRKENMERDVNSKDKDKELADAWGMLGNAELRVTIKGEIPTDTSGHHHPDSHLNLGYVTLNLAEFAPYPESPLHHHHHHHHHPHHHHHQHPHPQSNASRGTHLPTLARNETRRYLLNDSRTNATLKLTIEMTHMGGSREYAVPAVRRGLVVGGISTLMDGTPAGKSPGSSSNSEAGGSTEGHASELGRTGGYNSAGGHNRGISQNASMTSISRNPISNWPPNSVAKHSRIPTSNLKTQMSHQDAARAVKEAGGHRMGFSFGAGAYHDRPPEDVIDALFQSNSSNATNLMLPSTISRSEKAKGAPRRKKGGEDGKEESQSSHEDQRQVQRGIFSEKPEHYDGLSPAEHPKDGAQASSLNGHLARFPFATQTSTSTPGPDLQQRPTSNAPISEESKKQHHQTDQKSSKESSSSSTRRSILTNAITSKIVQPLIHLGTNSSDDQQHSNDNNKASNSSSTSSPSSSTRPSLVHWHASISPTDEVHHKYHESTSANPSTSSSSSSSNRLEVPNRQLTSSPSIISSASNDDTTPTESPLHGTYSGRTSTDDEHEARSSNSSSFVARFNPPSTPPDVLRKETINALDGKNVLEEVARAASKRGASKAAKGLTKEEAIEKGYKGVGWGTLNLGNVWATSLLEVPSNEGASPNHSLSLYSNSPTPSPSTQAREAVL